MIPRFLKGLLIPVGLSGSSSSSSTGLKRFLFLLLHLGVSSQFVGLKVGGGVGGDNGAGRSKQGEGEHTGGDGGGGSCGGDIHGRKNILYKKSQ